MLGQIFDGMVLLTLTVGIHGLVLGWSLRNLLSHRGDLDSPSTFLMVWTLSRLAIIVVMAHLFEILLWAIYFDWRDVIDGIELAFYFSAVTYATIGYGDIVPPDSWRLVSAMEGLTGILMCGWSGGYFFAVVARLYRLT